MSEPKDQAAQTSSQSTPEPADLTNQELSEQELDTVSGGTQDSSGKGGTVRDSVKGVDDALSQF